MVNRSRGKKTALTAVAAALLIILGAGIAWRDRMREQWYLWRLESGDENERDFAARMLAGMKSRRAVPILKELRAWKELLEIAGIGYRWLGHGSNALDLDGKDRACVVAILEDPDVTLHGDFRPPVYSRPDPLPAFSEQWIYNNPSRHSHIYLYFDRGSVVLAIEEWSDW